MHDVKNKKGKNLATSILMLPLNIIKWFFVGIFMLFYLLMSCVISILKYLILGLLTPFMLIIELLSKVFGPKQKRKLTDKELLEKQLQERKKLQEIEREKAKKFLLEEKKRHKEKAKKSEKDKKNSKDDKYVNENVKREKPKVDILGSIFSFFKSLPKKFVNRVKNSETKQYKKTEKELKHQILTLDFEGADATRSAEKILYRYEARSPEGKDVKDYMEAYSRVEVHSYLLSEGYTVYKIETNKWIRLFHQNAGKKAATFKTGDLIFFLTQLSTYLKAGIALVEALRILSRQYKKKGMRDTLKAVVYDLTMGENLSTAMEKQVGAFPNLLINMIKTAEMTGELPEVLDDMVEYYTEMNQTRKQMISALTYPMIVLVFSVAVIIFILVYIIPQFGEIYSTMDANAIPKFTLIVMGVSDFLKNNFVLFIIVILAIIVALIILYKSSLWFKTLCQKIAMHMPVFGNTIIYNEVTNFTKTFSSLLSHNVFITDSMGILNKITNNEIYKMIITQTIGNLAKGEKISAAFKDHWAFPMPAYEMLVTGETTGELPEMMKKVSNYYQMLHKDSVQKIKTFIEPLLTVFLTLIVGVIVLAIVIPMFSMYNSVSAV